ncbi:MAG: hypothetical protein D6814_06580, partial [Calditrichaeota bacterium]
MKAKSQILIWGIMLLVGSSNVLPAGLYQGKRLKLTGRWTGKYLEVSRVQRRDANRDPLTGLVKGKIDSVNYHLGILYMGPIRIQVSPSVKLQGLRPRELKRGKTVKAFGRVKGPRFLHAETVQASSSIRDFIQVLGAVASSRQHPNGDFELNILGVPARVPPDILDRGLSLIRHPDDKRPDKQLTLPLFGRPLIIGGEVGHSWKFRGDYKLEDRAKDDLLRMDQGVELELFYRPGKNVAIFLEGKSSRESLLYHQAQKHEIETEIERGEMWLYAGGLLGTGLGLQIGRQNFREFREWWWDEDMDAVRLYFNRQRIHGEFAVAREL